MCNRIRELGRLARLFGRKWRPEFLPAKRPRPEESVETGVVKHVLPGPQDGIDRPDPHHDLLPDPPADKIEHWQVLVIPVGCKDLTYQFADDQGRPVRFRPGRETTVI